MTASAASRPHLTEVDLGPCRGVRFDRGGDEWVILLPGANYPTTAPALWFAREVALAAGRNALTVLDSYDGRSDAQRWAEERAQAGIEHLGDSARPILVAKSITSLAAALAARLGLPAVWITPLINEAGTTVSRAVVDGLAAASAPFLLVGGSADPSWQGARARSFARGDVLEITDADHLLQIPGDVARSIEALRSVSAAVADFIGAVDGTERGEAVDGYLAGKGSDVQAALNEMFGSLPDLEVPGRDE